MPAHTEQPEKWTDNLLLTRDADIFFPKSIKDPAMIKLSLIRFYHLYFEGRLAKGLTLQDVLYGPIALIPPADYEEEFTTIWSASDYADDERAFFSTRPKQKGNAQTAETAKFASANSAENSKKFSHDVEELLLQWDPTSGVSGPIHGLLRLTGFLALTFCRAAVKNACQMGSIFSEKYRKNLCTQAGWDREKNFSPCSKSCRKILLRELKVGEQSTSAIYTKIVSLFVKEMRSAPVTIWDYKPTVAFLSTAVLAQTAGYGIELYALFQEVCRHFSGTNWLEIVEWTYMTSTKISWDKLVKMISEYHNAADFQHSHHWARIIDRDYLGDLELSSHYFLVGILGMVTAMWNGKGNIWNSDFAKEKGNLLTTPKLLGLALFEQLTTATEESALTEESRAILQLSAEVAKPNPPRDLDELLFGTSMYTSLKVSENSKAKIVAPPKPSSKSLLKHRIPSILEELMNVRGTEKSVKLVKQARDILAIWKLQRKSNAHNIDL